MDEREFWDFKIGEYVCCFGGAGRFFKKIIDSLDFDFSIIDVNNLGVEVSNKDGFFPGVKCHELYYGKEGGCKNCFIDKVIKTGVRVLVEKDGKEHYLYPIFDGKGRIISVIKYDLKKKEVVREVVKEVVKKVVKKVVVKDKEVDEIFYRILQNSQNLVYRYDFIRDKFKYISEAVFTLSGFPLGELMDMSYDDFLGRIHPDDSNEICDGEDVVGRESVCNKEYRWRCKDEKYRWFLDKRTLIFDDKRNIVSVIGDIRDVTHDKMAKLEKDSLEAKIAQMRQKENDAKQRSTLTDKEKIVLWGLCRYPLLNDEELSGKLELKRSTLTAIKNRLKEKGWFSLKYIPNFHKLGCEFLGFFDAILSKGVKVCDFDFVKNSPNVVFRNLQDEKFFGLFVSNKFVDFRKFIEEFCYQNKGMRIRDSSFFYELENFELRDASGLINFIFGLGRKGRGIVCDFSNDGVELNGNEKRVLHAMVQNPELSSSEIAKKIWISKPTVIKIKKKILEEEFIYSYIVPDFRKLGFNFMAKFSYEFDSEIPKEVKKSGVDSMILFKVMGKKRIVKFVLFESEEEYLEEVDLIRDTYRKIGFYFNFKSDIFPIQKRGKGNLNLESFIGELLFDKI
ncbi:PAS domain-containing protein [Candidatus Pacearchaeota archaeon]|nr:PAS domain-containing protein [Candidatus Pacearchaeota archaeon]